MNLLAVTGLDRFNPAQGGVRGMRVVATGLLLVMAVTYLTARALEQQHPAFGFVRAFAEAAMVGGLADWFAVTALFRHPLGLPIPHTAIIPRNKDRIGGTLAQFLRDNFLTPSVVARRMHRLDIAAAAGRWLATPQENTLLRAGAGRFLGNVVEALADERLGGMIKGAIVGRLRALDISPLLGQALAAAINENRHIPLLDGVIRWAGLTLAANEALIREMVHHRAGSILRWTGLDEKLANAILEGLAKMLSEMAEDPDHPLRAKAEEGLHSLAHDLVHDEATQAKVARFRDMIIANPAIVAWIDRMWQSVRENILTAARNPDIMGSGRLGEALRQIGETILGDAQLRKTINRFARRSAVGAAASYGDGIVKLVSETIRGWDADTVTNRLESAVGRDLQYIRINGTLVGGLVGLGLHLFSKFL